MAETRVRTATTDAYDSDTMFVLHCFDSALVYLASIGSNSQWGNQLFSQKPKRVKEFTQFVEESQGVHDQVDDDLVGWKRMMILEKRMDQDEDWIRVAALGMSDEFPDYVPDSVKGASKGSNDYLYINHLITDKTTPLSKGGGSRLLAEAMQECKKRGKNKMYLDCWRGNQDLLFKYYQSQGFSVVAEFQVEGKHTKGSVWTGYLLEKAV